MWSAITYARECALPNVGVTIDVGHSLEAYENVAEAICAAASRGLLFHMHINDNYRLWDDDMITGSIHTCLLYTSGMVELDKDGNFSSFYGAIQVTSSLSDLFWRRIATKAQREKMLQNVPTEYSLSLIHIWSLSAKCGSSSR